LFAHRFVTRTDLSRLGLEHLLGTSLLRAYMHGFFIDARLYSKAAAAVQPHAYEAWRAAKVAQKLEDERQGRISVARKLPKVGLRGLGGWGGGVSQGGAEAGGGAARVHH
jgi:ribosome biogenesis protein ENP2